MRREGYGGSAWAVVLGHGRGAPLKTAVVCSSSPQHWSQGDETSGMRMFANGGLQENWKYRGHRERFWAKYDSRNVFGAVGAELLQSKASETVNL